MPDILLVLWYLVFFPFCLAQLLFYSPVTYVFRWLHGWSPFPSEGFLEVCSLEITDYKLIYTVFVSPSIMPLALLDRAVWTDLKTSNLEMHPSSLVMVFNPSIGGSL